MLQKMLWEFFAPIHNSFFFVFEQKMCQLCKGFLPSFLPLLMCSRAALVVSGFFLVLFFETLICQVNFFVWLLSLYLQNTHTVCLFTTLLSFLVCYANSLSLPQFRLSPKAFVGHIQDMGKARTVNKEIVENTHFEEN